MALPVTATLDLKTLSVLSLGASSLGFKSFVYFFSLGYGAVMTVLGSIALALASNKSLAAKLHGAAFVVYGVRLFLFLLRRETTVEDQRKRIADREEKATLKSKLSIWVFCGLLYPLMFSPCLYHLKSATPAPAGLGSITTFAGLGIMWFGIVFEAIADQQKTSFKASPRLAQNGFCDVGVWALSRHANYLGEILVYVGNFIAGLPFLGLRPVPWICSLIGTAGIVNTMVSATERLDKQQAEKYGEAAAFKEYVQVTPKLFPGF